MSSFGKTATVRFVRIAYLDFSYIFRIETINEPFGLKNINKPVRAMRPVYRPLSYTSILFYFFELFIRGCHLISISFGHLLSVLCCKIYILCTLWCCRIICIYWIQYLLTYLLITYLLHVYLWLTCSRPSQSIYGDIERLQHHVAQSIVHCLLLSTTQADGNICKVKKWVCVCIIYGSDMYRRSFYYSWCCAIW